ncbi:uncharacterized protein V6R79_016723 [Siganus canaliculatus]
MLLLVLLLICVEASLQLQTPPPGRCDVSQREDVHTTCTSLAACGSSSCPLGFSSVGINNCSYQVVVGSRELLMDGCQHVCVKRFLQPQCCPQHWGPLCLPCPTWSGKTCNFHGTCLDGDVGNGTCVCDDGFSGFACQECSRPSAYGDRCDKECDCEHGMCNKGPDGDGQCLCQPPYSGRRCDRVNSRCSSCSSYSFCRGDGDAADCQCLPGHRRTPQGKCASICSPGDCDVNAQCSSQGSKVSCACKPDYEGDGRICVPRNPCSINNGGCPVNSTVCVFRGPNKSSCECMHGMAPVGGSAAFGCQLLSACSADTCDPSAACQTGLDARPRCVCDVGQLGDGYRCYGNLMERVIELDRSGDQRGNLTGAVDLFEKGCSLLLSHHGPFTAFVPVLRSPLTGVDAEAVCKNHLILGQHLYKSLEARDFNLYSGAQLRGKGSKRFLLMDDPSRLYTIIQGDLPASNGIIHIVDRPITNTPPGRAAPDQRFAAQTIRDILTSEQQFNRFRSLFEFSDPPPGLHGPGPLTVFVPTNDAVDRARDGSIVYMMKDARHKLTELVRHHVYTQATLTVDELTAHSQIKTMSNQIVSITVSDTGEIRLGEKGFHLVGTGIIAANGIIHVIDGLLVPPSITPILPHRCDVTESKIVQGPCVHCPFLHTTECPEGTTEMDAHQTGCEYYIHPSRTATNGCAKFCNATRQVAQCCAGFYGPDCKPCIGGFQTPCYNKGTCFDGIHGNGSCSCQSAFEGVACHICTDPSKHGQNCDEDCSCVHGVCDNRGGSRGVCRSGSCVDGFSGENCDQTAAVCNSDGLKQHCHLQAVCRQRGLLTQCVCRDGYDGDGHSCSPINPCLKSDRGGCSSNAECVFAAPGRASCVCSEGWTGDGRVCVEVNNCQLEARGGCSPNADCVHLGPGQSKCECRRGFMGDGAQCDPVNPCQSRNGGCHDLARCELKEGGTHTCTCPEGYAGDGVLCYGTLQDELEMNVKLYSFSRLIQKFSHASEDLSLNLTVLVPSREAMRNMTSEQTSFWSSRHHLPHFLRAHFLVGIYSVEDLDRLVGSRLPTMNPQTLWQISNVSGVVRIGNASIVSPNLPAVNGYIHIIDQTLAPPTSDLPPEPPTLMSLLNSSSNFTLFRQYAQMFNLSSLLDDSDFTLLLPTDDAVRQHLITTNSSLLDADVLKYHVIPGELLFPDHLSDGTLKGTLLGDDHQVQFHLNADNQTLVNDAPLHSGFMETQRGVVIVLPQVLRVRRNRCSKQLTLQVNGRCSDCQGPPRCLFSYAPIRAVFPANMKPNCRYRKRVGSRRKSVPGCVIKCLRMLKDHSCCPGYYGHECFKCPGDVGSWCSNHGQCQDGNHGNGECRCYEGFHGTACEDCEPGRYGVNCTSKCGCVQGKCDDGLTGSGRCSCRKGWKGTKCSVEIRDDACGGVCDENANCITGPSGSAPACVCVAGYKGNGTHCEEQDMCQWSNGGCSQFAVCTKVSAGERTCTCRAGYTGDGVVCLEIDGCLLNNGGCHKSAECIRTGPNTTACRCLTGFQGSGRFCFPVNPCRKDNGGCDKNARCEYLGQGQVNCSCYRGHVGDGFSCRGSANNEIQQRPENSFLRNMLMLQRLKDNSRTLYGSGPFTVFVPLPETNNESSVLDWTQSGRISDLVRYHIVSCETLTLSDLQTAGKVMATSGHTLTFSLQQGSVWINGRSKVVRSDYVTSDGVIHHIQSMLTPYRVQDRPKIISGSMNYTSAAVFYGYSRFYKLVQDAGLIPVLQRSIHQPFTMLWPTDEALSALPAERQRWLSSPDHVDQLAAIVKAHIIRNSRVLGLAQPDKYSSFRTMHGSTIKYSCDKTMVGSVLINGNAARLVERYLSFKEGVAYGIDQLLEPPGLGAFCDTMENRTTNGRCGDCFLVPSCMSHTDTGRTESCTRSRSHYRRYPSWSLNLDPFSRRGCRRICQYQAWAQKCCKNHYSRDCQVCPGGVEAPCSNHGNCDDGVRGSGRCSCHVGFRGDACELCSIGYYGPNCTACSCSVHGDCDQGMDGSGRCLCRPGWTGDRCQTDVGSIPEECLQCHPQADCVPGTGCQCRPGLEGNGTFCSPAPPPDLCSDYNGGCHLNADCNQTGLTVNCTCRSGYHGDGFSCQPINRCTQEPNGGCSDFASCKFTGPNQRDCECLPGYVGNGVQCLEEVVPPVDRCLEDNGGCDPVATCSDLHYHTKTAGVFHLRSPEGRYQMNLSQAESACQDQGAVLASLQQLGDAQQLGMHLCAAGWMEGGKVGYPTRFPVVKCGNNHVGVVLYKDPVDQSSKYDAYCYRLQDVSCVCPDAYIGNGDFCHGVLSSVLATNANFSTFYRMLLDYSGSSSEGKQLLDFLSHRTSEVTVFVPHNAGFTYNKTLSGRDLEYHVSANHSRRAFTELKHRDVIVSRLGLDLTVTQRGNQSSKLVNQRLLLEWDVPATNGIIHVIEAPLTAPPPPGPPHAARGHAHSSGTLSAILVSLLLAGVLAVLGYFVFRHRTDAFRFHYFRNDDEDGASGPGAKPSLVSIPNPLYSGARAFSEPFGDQDQDHSQELEPTEAEEAPKILDLDQ